VTLQILLYASPVIISVATVKAKVSPTVLHIYMLNPLATLFQQFRHSFITHAAPSAGEALGGWAGLIGPAVIIIGTFILGFWVFNRAAVKIAENL